MRSMLVFMDGGATYYIDLNMYTYLGISNVLFLSLYTLKAIYVILVTHYSTPSVIHLSSPTFATLLAPSSSILTSPPFYFNEPLMKVGYSTY